MHLSANSYLENLAATIWPEVDEFYVEISFENGEKMYPVKEDKGYTFVDKELDSDTFTREEIIELSIYLDDVYDGDDGVYLGFTRVTTRRMDDE